MTDQRDISSLLLLEHIRKPANKQHALWLIDENISEEHLQQVAHLDLDIISNRYDHYLFSQKHSLNIAFHDFEFEKVKSNFYDVVYFRICKEKPLCEHWINLAAQALKKNGTLFICGAKSEGLASIKKIAGNAFQSSESKIAKNKQSQLLSFQNSNNSYQNTSDAYQQWQTLSHSNLSPIYSKAGQYGFKKIDKGSALLASHFDEIYKRFSEKPNSILDLGCGYGFLSLMTKDFDIKQRVAVDNNAAAIASINKNALEYVLDIEIFPSNIGSALLENNSSSKFDWIICNPPFHSGFFHDSNLTLNFLSDAKKLLAKNGMASFVSNQFVPIKKIAESLAMKVELLSQEDGFNIHLITH